MRVVLRQIALPDFGSPETYPALPIAEYDARLSELYRHAGMDWVVVYGDREHAANIAFLTGYDPRFEEALVLIGPEGRCYLLVGNEGLGYAVVATPLVEVILCQTLSLCGQTREQAPRLLDVLRTLGLRAGARIGVIGWKYLEPYETDDAAAPAFVPAMLVDVLRRLGGESGEVRDVTSLMMHPAFGMRAQNSAAQLAVFEWAAVRASQGIMNVVRGIRPGMTEWEAMSLLGYQGEPLSIHPVFASGKDLLNGLRSPGPRRIERGDAVSAGIGYWGSLSCRAGLVLDTPDERFLNEVVVPYYTAIVTWYRQMTIGASGGAIERAVRAAFGEAPFNSLLNPGHLVSLEEWVHTPIRPGSTETIASGMVFQCDIIPSPLGPGRALNCEDTVAIAGDRLRAELAEGYPELWGRIQARRAFMRDVLGLTLAEEVLPLSMAPAYLPPFWLASDLVCTVAE